MPKEKKKTMGGFSWPRPKYSTMGKTSSPTLPASFSASSTSKSVVTLFGTDATHLHTAIALPPQPATLFTSYLAESQWSSADTPSSPIPPAPSMVPPASKIVATVIKAGTAHTVPKIPPHLEAVSAPPSSQALWIWPPQEKEDTFSALPTTDETTPSGLSTTADAASSDLPTPGTTTPSNLSTTSETTSPDLPTTDGTVVVATSPLTVVETASPVPSTSTDIPTAPSSIPSLLPTATACNSTTGVGCGSRVMDRGTKVGTVMGGVGIVALFFGSVLYCYRRRWMHCLRQRRDRGRGTAYSTSPTVIQTNPATTTQIRPADASRTRPTATTQTKPTATTCTRPTATTQTRPTATHQTTITITSPEDPADVLSRARKQIRNNSFDQRIPSPGIGSSGTYRRGRRLDSTRSDVRIPSPGIGPSGTYRRGRRLDSTLPGVDKAYSKARARSESPVPSEHSESCRGKSPQRRLTTRSEACPGSETIKHENRRYEIESSSDETLLERRSSAEMGEASKAPGFQPLRNLSVVDLLKPITDLETAAGASNVETWTAEVQEPTTPETDPTTLEIDPTTCAREGEVHTARWEAIPIMTLDQVCAQIRNSNPYQETSKAAEPATKSVRKPRRSYSRRMHVPRVPSTVREMREETNKDFDEELESVRRWREEMDSYPDDEGTPTEPEPKTLEHEDNAAPELSNERADTAPPLSNEDADAAPKPSDQRAGPPRFYFPVFDGDARPDLKE